jgi:hypothetical protein
MKKIELSLPEFIFVVLTRAALGAGAGILVSRKLSRRRRPKVGLALLTFGILTTVPAAFLVRRSLGSSTSRIASAAA